MGRHGQQHGTSICMLSSAIPMPKDCTSSSACMLPSSSSRMCTTTLIRAVTSALVFEFSEKTLNNQSITTLLLLRCRLKLYFYFYYLGQKCCNFSCTLITARLRSISLMAWLRSSLPGFVTTTGAGSAISLEASLPMLRMVLAFESELRELANETADSVTLAYWPCMRW